MGAVDHEIVIVGAGFAGIGTAITLLRAGYWQHGDLLLLDDASGPGGTWHWNTYPGVAVDIPSFSYQFSFEQRPDWSRSYAPGEELRAYAEHCVDKYGLRPRIRFGTEVTEASWDEAGARWRIETAAGDEITARFLVNACGVLTRPKYPDIPGVEQFAGVTVHTARWDHDVDLYGQRVGIIGTGASAVQIIPAIAPEVAQLTVFQRTPIWCLPKPDLPIPGAARWALRRLPGASAVSRLASQAFVEATFPLSAHYHGRLPVSSLFERFALGYLGSQVHDPAVREKLTPRYALGCKRPSFHNSYLSTFNQPHVHLETTPIESVDDRSVRTADGEAHELDVLILATGFKVMDTDSLPTYRLVGRNGRLISQWWNEERLQAYEGVSAPGYPNYFSIMGPYGYNGSSYFTLIENGAAHVLRCLKQARKVQADVVEVTKEAHDAYFAEVLERREHQIFWQESCGLANSYYFDRHGDVPLRPMTTMEAAWRSRHFPLHHYTFSSVREPAAVG
ncbi:MAG: flavin-containing monooxygenase [Jatrophihabitans sp.]|uniref:flavin-containing monooxygenase n=1 Tax=Jatrophihabitans sp. TaxID=1932789 RepID=UPI003F822CFC